MATLLRILKYTPAVVMGLLVVAWVVSTFGWVVHEGAINQRSFGIGIGSGTIQLWTYLKTAAPIGFGYGIYREPWGFSRLAGGFGFDPGLDRKPIASLHFPIAFTISLLLPVAVGPLISFRFRLRHYLAYTALVAVELAYYLRRQE